MGFPCQMLSSRLRNWPIADWQLMANEIKKQTVE